MPVKPISPGEILAAKQSNMPDDVLNAFNILIIQHWNGQQSRFTQKDVVALILQVSQCEEAQFNYDWLDVEDIYRAQGWRVEYDKPGYNETYLATFTFKKKSSR